MRNTMLVLGLAGLIAGGSWAEAGACVKAEGAFVQAFLFREASFEEAAAASREVSLSEQFRLKKTAEAMADAACNVDETGIVSSIMVAAYLDGTAVEVESLRLNAVVKNRRTLLAVVKSFAVSVRKTEPVVVRLIPVRIGGAPARVVAVVYPGEAPKFIQCSDAACNEPKRGPR